MLPLICTLLIGLQVPGPEDLAASTVSATALVRGDRIPYRAVSAQTPIRSETGEIEARMFSVSYFKDGADPKSRPVTFCFNGGPGSATLWLHLGGLGPKRAPMPDDGSLPKPPYAVVDNPDSWLTFTDLVFVDAPGTGYSRLAKPDLKTKFYGVAEDIRAFTDFVRGWLKQYDRWQSPIFIAGESYGGLRGSGLCNRLLEAGTAVSGFISISGSNNFLTLDGMTGNDVTYISFLPTFAACAWYHKKTPQFRDVESAVRAAQAFVDQEYAGALARGDSLAPDEKDRIAGKMADLTGLSKTYCLDSNLRVSEFAFFRELLRDRSLSIGRYDGRLTARENSKIGEYPSSDPSDTAVTSPFVTCVNAYLQGDLKVKTDMRYNTFGNVYPWKDPEGRFADTSTDLRTVLTLNPHFRVLFACGYYDSACTFQGTIYTVNHLNLSPGEKARISYAYYPAGHMMYIEKSSRIKLHDDVAAFVAQALR